MSRLSLGIAPQNQDDVVVELLAASLTARRAQASPSPSFCRSSAPARIGHPGPASLARRQRAEHHEQAEEDDPRIWAGWYEVPVAPGLSAIDRRLEVRRRLAGSLKQHADLYLPDRLAEVCRGARLDKPSIIIREQRRRWGSCDANGTLRINWRIVQALIRLIEYVLAHELTHLTYPDHSPEFWAALGRMMPDYEDRRRRLRTLGSALEW